MSKNICLGLFLLPFFPAGCSLSTPTKFNVDGAAENDIEEATGDFDVTVDDVDVDIPPTCGNGAVDSGEECDDGNGTDGDGCDADCTFSCREAGECSDGNLCNGAEQCDTGAHTCAPGDPSPAGFICLEAPRSICLGGACVESACGDGYVDTGAGEFCDPPGGACLPDCTLGCASSAECLDDGNPCNGTEFCNIDSGRCERTAPLLSGDVCGEGPRRICISGSCQQSICGDSFTDAGTEPPEECDDGNNTSGDGCENDCMFTCNGDLDCNDGEVCNGDETCDAAFHMCRVGSNLPPRSPCDDLLACTRTDECNGLGRCMGTGNPCSDAVPCTDDICSEPEGDCRFPILPNHCLISGTCIYEGTVDANNPCRSCQSAVATDMWTPLPDMTTCNQGICCGGICRSMGTCCSDSDCSGACTGMAAPCEDFWPDEMCLSQFGCSWTGTGVSFCSGAPRTCFDITRLDSISECQACGCAGVIFSGDQWHCTGGPPSPCNSFSSDPVCSSCLCAWTTGEGACTGTHSPCASNLDATSCGSQFDCAWTGSACTGYQCE